jgi:glycosyltransferase involved in cell wall biosynthesis
VESPRFTVLIPVTRPPLLLPYAIESVLAQHVADFELFVVCDGAPAETIACAEDYARRDPRVKVRAFPKGERHGEAHRHEVLRGAAGRYVAHIADDDLWLPDHLGELQILLSAVDFGHLLHVYAHADGRFEIVPGDLAMPETRRRMLSEAYNLFGPTFAGYRLDAYRRLPEGWTPAPTDLWTDLHMWRKFLRADGLAFGTRCAVTAIQLPAPERRDRTLEQRQEETRACWERVRDPHRRHELVEAVWRSVLERSWHQGHQIQALAAARSELTAANEALQAELRRLLASG